MASDNHFDNAFDYKIIYVFEIQNNEQYKGLIKIGDATLHTLTPIDSLTPNSKELNQAALKRIASYTGTAGLTPKVLWTELAVRNIKGKDGAPVLKAFRDHDVHHVLTNSNIKNFKLGNSKEWFKLDIETAKEAIKAVKCNKVNISGKGSVISAPIIFRPEQIDAITKTVKQFRSGDRMLWNAKMRFGKTICALEVVKRLELKKTIIITHRPVVNAGWYEDFGKIFQESDAYVYGSKANGYSVSELIKTKKNFVYFASIQDLRGSLTIGGKFDKNDIIFSTEWDCVIVDEAHEGTTTSLGDDVIKNIVKAESGHHTKFLALSGTPFNILNDFDEASIYTWDYIMEQESKAEWDKEHFGDSNPYDELPELRIYTYDLGNIIPKDTNYISFEDKAFNFREFFRTWTGDFNLDHTDMPANAKIGDFVHEQDITSFLNLMTHEDPENCYPYSNEEYRSLFRHSLWMIPGVKEAHALKELMQKHKVFGSGAFDIVNVAGEDGEENEGALNAVKNAIKEANKSEQYTITLSCGKLTTGVTVREWTAVFMLAGAYSTSAANYLQTIFRVQSPCNENGKIKDVAYVFDFAPDRTLKMVASAVSVSSKAGKTSTSDKQALGKFLNYCPVISISGSEMKKYDTAKLLQQLKKAYAERAVMSGFDDMTLYNDELLKLDKLEIQKFNKLKDIIGATKASERTNEININNQGLTKEEYEEKEKLDKKPKKSLSEEEKKRLKELNEQRALRKTAIDILRGISIRMPLLIYGADVPYDEDITLEKFVSLVDDDSWNEFMPIGVTKKIFKGFEKYYDEEIFIAAGRRIRNLSKEADTLPPTARVKKITELFSYFRNPDKETILTPWRVVNMHMSDCLGGWDFWDEAHKSVIETPRFVDRGEVTKKIFANPDTHILEINSKTGLYPLYVAYSTYQEKCRHRNNDKLSDEEKQSIWNETIANNIFVICKTPMAQAITQRTLMGYNKRPSNCRHIPNLIDKMKHAPKNIKKRILNGKFWKKECGRMRFDACVGNPPYQAYLGGASPLPVYHYFINQAKALNPQYISMITPARWFNTGTGLNEFRSEMLSDDRIRILHDYLNANECFTNVEIKGGIEYFLWDNEYHGMCDVTTHYEDGKIANIKRFLREPGLDTFIRDSRVIPILEKVRSIKEDSFMTLVSPRDPFGYDIRLEGSMKVAPHEYSLSKSKDADVEFYYNGWRKDGVGYVSAKSVNENQSWIDKYKVLIPKAWGTGDTRKDKLNPFIIKPHSVCTETFLVVGPFETYQEAKNAEAYINTKFFLFLVSILKISQNAARGVYELVPMQDFTKKWDDEELYAKYKLSDQETIFIESMIRCS